MKGVLVHNDLWPVVSGALVERATANPKSFSEAKDQKTLAAIIVCLHPSQLNYAKNSKTSLEG